MDTAPAYPNHIVPLEEVRGFSNCSMVKFEVSRNDFLKRSRFQVYFGEKSLKTKKNILGAAVLAILTISLALPLTALPVSAAEERVQATWRTNGNWIYIQNDIITIMFPAGGKKPMFLWWHTNAPDNIYVVKYKGLVEYTPLVGPYFLWRYRAEAAIMQQQIQAHYYEPRRHMLNQNGQQQALQTLAKIGEALDLHSPYLPFSGCQWELSPPINVTKGDIQYLSFNFTLVDVPGYRPNLQFAENNIIIRCRFYYTPATEDVYGKYTYTVNTSEFKMDLVINHWEWNIDKLEPILNTLRDLGLDIPESRASLALWINLASINLTQLPIAEQDATTPGDTAYTENAATTQNMYVEGQNIQVTQNRTGTQDEHPMQHRWRERYRFRFEKGNTTLAGFFKFVPQAIITDGTTYNTTDVTASYIEAGSHMRVFLGYPYFGNNTLEHDPSLGLEEIPILMTPMLLLLLVGAATIITVTVLAVKWKKRTINIVSPK